MMRASLSSLGLACVLAGCLDPLVTDEPTYSPEVRPPGSFVAQVTDDPAAAQRIANGDGVDASPVPRRVGYADGAEVAFFDFGEGTNITAPMWIFRRCDPDGGLPLPGDQSWVGHPNLFESVPGDAAYSPFRSLWLVCVTDRYDGELITSRTGLADAIALGLVEEPKPTDTFGDFPVTLPDVTLDVGGGVPPVAPDTGFYDGMRAAIFHLGGDDAGTYPLGSTVKPLRVYRLTKAEDEAFEQIVFAAGHRLGDAPNPDYVPLFQIVEVTMSAAYDGAARSEAELFTVASSGLTPAHAQIVSFEATDAIVHWAIQYEEGRP